MKNLIGKQSSAVVFGLAFMGAFSITQAAGTSSAQFLKLGAGARAAGMGDAFCSIADDVNAAYWNPAGLAQLKSGELSIMHNSYLQDTQYQFLGGALRIGNGTLAASVQRLDYGSIDRYTAADAKDGSFDAGSIAGGVSLGMMMSRDLMAGFTMKYLQESIEKERASSFAGDLGGIFKYHRYTFGASLQHLGPGLKMVKDTNPLPLTVRAGASARFLENRLLAAAELSKPNDNDVAFHLGAEYRIMDSLFFRGGYQVTPGNSLDVNGITGITGGLGISFDRYTLDYSLAPFGDLGSSHRISLKIKFSN